MTQRIADKDRKKVFAHKVRSGCDSCKRRHIKCPEEKPICSRCEKAGFECKYNAPKARLFEVSERESATEIVPIPTHLYKRTEDDGFTFLDPAPGSGFGTWLERRALEYWLTVTGPWMSKYVPRSHSALWMTVIPRCAHLLAASRHLLIAIALLDERSHRLEPPELLTRAKTVVEHYNKAIKILTSGKAEPLDFYLAPILAWIIEIMINNPNTAMMHLNSSRKMLQSASPRPHNSNETQDIVCDFLKDAQRFCTGFTSTSAACAGVLNEDPISIFQVLNVRQGLNPGTTSEEVRQAIYKYASSLDENGQTTFAVKEALSYLRHWETTLLIRRFTEHEAADTIVATHFLVATTTTLMAVHDGPQSDPSYRQDQAFEYLLMKFEDCLDTRDLDELSRQGLEDATAFALFLIVRFSKSIEQRQRAMVLIARCKPSDKIGISWEEMIRTASACVGGYRSETASPGLSSLYSGDTLSTITEITAPSLETPKGSVVDLLVN